MSARIGSLPAYRLHKATGQAVVTLNGKCFYLGRHSTPASVAAYDRTIAEWLARGRIPRRDEPTQCVTIGDILDAFTAHARIYYRHPDGTPSDEFKSYGLAIRPLRTLFAALPAAQFGPLALKQVRENMIGRGWSRKVINRQIGRLRSLFGWAVSRELIPAGIHQALATLEPLRAGKSAAPERDPVRPVPMEHVHAVLPLVSRQVRALIQLQLLTGARAGELLSMRPLDLCSSGDVWTYRPSQHKTAHRGHERTIYLGPQAQAIVAPFLAGRPVDAYLFCPAEAEAERHELQRLARLTPVQPSQQLRGLRSACRDRQRPPRTCYDVASYRRAIARAAAVAGVPSWSPHRLRHNAATAIRQQYGIEVARLILGHKCSAMTEIYAEQDRGKAESVMLRIG